MIHKAGQKLVYPKEYSVVQQASSVAAWWSGGYAAYDFTALTYTLAKDDLTGNGRHATDGAAYPTHAAGVGCTFNGTSQYLITPVIPATGWSALVKFSGASGAGSRAQFGQSNGGDTRFLVAGIDNGARTYGAGGYISIAGTKTSGTLGIAGQKAYYNGLPDGGAIYGPGWSTIRAIYIGCINLSGSPTLYYTGNISSLIIYDTTRSDAQIMATSTAMP